MKMFNLIVFLVISMPCCKSQNKFNLFCDLQNGITFSDSSKVFLNKELIGVLTVEKLESDKIKAKISLNSNTQLPINSSLIFHEVPFGVSYFEILVGNAKEILKDNDRIRY